MSKLEKKKSSKKKHKKHKKINLGQNLIKALKQATTFELKRPQKAIDKLRAIHNMGPDVEVPWEVMRLFPDGFKCIEIMGTDLSFGGDYMKLREARAALNWMVSQLGGTVKWDLN